MFASRCTLPPARSATYGLPFQPSFASYVMYSPANATRVPFGDHTGSAARSATFCASPPDALATQSSNVAHRWGSEPHEAGLIAVYASLSPTGDQTGFRIA